MYFSEVKQYDIANGPGVRVTIFVSGCSHHCPGCFNEMTWDYTYGRVFEAQDKEWILKTLAMPYIAGLTLLGGEPMEYVNQQGLLPLVKSAKKQYPDKTIWCYTGYRFETELLEDFCSKWEVTREFLSCLDVIVDGRFELHKKDISLRFRGSSNQRIIDVQASLKAGETVLWDDGQ